jgi:hypothetical protein
VRLGPTRFSTRTGIRRSKSRSRSIPALSDALLFRPVSRLAYSRWLTRGVLGVGLASFFSDSGHEIATSLRPALSTVTLQSTAGLLGLIEGISDALTGIAKLVAGPFVRERQRAQAVNGLRRVPAHGTGHRCAWSRRDGVSSSSRPGHSLAGSGIGLAETAQSALVARLLPDSLRGSGFGLFGRMPALGDFASSAIVGLLWVAVSPEAGFIYAAALMVASPVASALLRPPGREG